MHNNECLFQTKDKRISQIERMELDLVQWFKRDGLIVQIGFRCYNRPGCTNL